MPQEELLNSKSEFDGGLLGLIGIRIAAALLTLITLGIAYPWAMCLAYRWKTKHTVVDGRRLVVDGTGGQLFGSYIKWFLLCIITFLIYSLWLPIKLTQWKTKHTHFA